MDAVYGGSDPKSVSGSRASHSVAPIAAPTATELPETSSRIGQVGDATRSTVKRKAVDDDPATRVMHEINTTRESTLVSDQLDEHGKRLKLVPETESTALAEISKMSVTDSEALSNYNAAFTLLNDNPPEKRLDVQLPYEKFVQLDAAFSELKSTAGISEDQRYPSLAYNSLSETVTVVTVPSSIHEGAARWIEKDIIDFAQDYLYSRSSQTVNNIYYVGSTTQFFPRGGYTRSRKEPDGGFTYISVGGENKLAIAIEVGNSETYARLCEDKDLWIEGKGVNVVILVCFNEMPRFTFPDTPPYQNVTDVRSELTAMSRIVGDTTESNIPQSYYGPLGYRDHTWVGKLTEAFIEIWRQDRNPVRYELIRDGFSVANLPNTLGLMVSDLYSRDAWEAADIPDSIIPFHSTRFIQRLRGHCIAAAMGRFEEFLYEKLGLH
ncbi:hypothetical protein V1505DRAFT_334567 [Lipomyces doorenjongii]